MGYYSSAYCIFTPVMAVASAGIPSAMARLAAENYAFERFANLRRTKRVAAVLFTCIGLVLTCAVILLAAPAAQLLTGHKNAGIVILPHSCSQDTRTQASLSPASHRHFFSVP